MSFGLSYLFSRVSKCFIAKKFDVDHATLGQHVLTRCYSVASQANV